MESSFHFRLGDVVVGFTTHLCNHHLSCEFEYCSWGGVLNTTLCDKVCQCLVTGRWFSPGSLVSSTDKIDLHNITDILLKVVLNTITLTPFLTVATDLKLSDTEYDIKPQSQLKEIVNDI